MSDTGNPLLSQPPTTVSVGDVAKQEIDPAAAAFLAALGIVKSGIVEKFFGVRAAAMIDSATTITAILTGQWDKLMTVVGSLFLAAQGEQNSSFYDLAAAVVEDLTGVKPDAAALKQSTFGSGRLAGMEALGGDIFDLLQNEFAPNGTLDPDQGLGAAKTFIGFLMNFSIRQGNVAAMCEAMPKELGFLSGFRDYGEQMAKNLGLGRMARRALAPLIQLTIADPLTWKLNQLYRPKMLAEAQMIHRFFRDPSTKDRMVADLAKLGYSDETQADLIADAQALLPEREIIEYAFRFGATTSTIGGQSALDPKSLLMQRGFTSDDADKMIAVSRPVLKENEISLLYVNGAMDQTTALSYFTKLGYDDATAALALQAHSFSHQHAHRLGLGMLKKMLHDNVIDILEFAAHLTAQGYSADDIKLLQLEFLQPTTGKVRQLSLAEIKAGYKAGALNEIQAADHLKILGYSDADIGVILKTLTPPKPPATPAPPPVA
jgi:hypothetical protein